LPRGDFRVSDRSGNRPDADHGRSSFTSHRIGRRSRHPNERGTPDLLAPWRHPTLTVIYADQPIDMSALGFVPAEGRIDASLIVRHTSDSTLLSACEPWPHSADGLPITDPLQQIWDLHDLSGEDRRKGALRLRQT
jgi:hypothetical protein